MPQITDQEMLLEKFDLKLIAKGPLGGWRGDYLKCPICGYYVYKGPGYDACPCDNIVVDSDYLRAIVKDSSECDVECYTATSRERN